MAWLLAGADLDSPAPATTSAPVVVFATSAHCSAPPSSSGACAAAAPAAVALFLYYAMLIGLVPQQGISWEGHLAGFLSGIAISRTMVRPRERRVDDELPIAGDYWME
ncbi:MAG: rhomboid family intramembrane serine protease [Acidimicrobiales bacterium]